MLVHQYPFSWLQVVSHFPNRRISACLYMTAWARQFACTTDNKRACACQNRWRCVTVSTQCCLLLAWPSTPCHVSFHNQGKGKMGRRNHPAFLPVSFCYRLFGINLMPMPLAMLFPSHFLLFLACFVPSCWLSVARLCFALLFVLLPNSTQIYRVARPPFVCCFKIAFRFPNRDNEICLLWFGPDQCQKVSLLFLDAFLFIFPILNWQSWKSCFLGGAGVWGVDKK